MCPIETPNRFDEGLRGRKAAYKLYPQAMPGAYAIEKRGTAPCKATCPAHVSVQGWIALISQNKYAEALALFKSTPSPASAAASATIPARVCTRQKVDEPLGIQYLHRQLGDWDLSGASPTSPITEAGQRRRWP